MLFKGQPAPDFELNDIHGKSYRLSDFRGEKVVILAFLRGFM
jgi:peroxiredoxin